MYTANPCNTVIERAIQASNNDKMERHSLSRYNLAVTLYAISEAAHPLRRSRLALRFPEFLKNASLTVSETRKLRVTI